MNWTRGAAAAMVLAVLVFGVAGQNTDFVFNPSASPSQGDGILRVSGDAAEDSQGQYVTMNDRIAHQQLPVTKGECWRVVYKDKVRMVDKKSGAVASFSTSFTFSFASFDNDSTSCGSGMLFTFSANSTVSPAENLLAGGSMCALNWKDPNLPLLAVEFDSHKNSNPLMFDVSDSHISLDVGVKTVNTSDLCVPANSNQTCAYFCKDPGARYMAWIDYDSAKQILEVRFGKGSGIAKPVDPVISYAGLRLNEMLDEDMYVGFIASTGVSREVHTIWSWEFASTGIPKPSKSSLAWIYGLCGGALGAMVLIIAGVLWYCRFVRHRTNPQPLYELQRISFNEHREGEETGNAISIPGREETGNSTLILRRKSLLSSMSYTFKELSDITNSFGTSELLSSGGFGDVFKGTLPSGDLVAIKRIKEGNVQAGEKSFLAEVETLQQTRHRNLLQLRGWCHSPDGMCLVYDFMCNGSLSDRLYPNGEMLWDVRLNILAGVASGLKYLHEDVGRLKCVLHRDIKSSNVLLDADFNAYLGDFGLARLLDHRRMEKSTLPAGTWGYIAPEMVHTGKASKGTDVYAFGILVLEVVCGKIPLPKDEKGEIERLVDIVWRAHKSGRIGEVVDPRLAVNVGSHLDEDGAANQMLLPKGLELPADVLHCGLLCSHADPVNRPSMQTVDQWFQSREAIALPPLPASEHNSSEHTSSSLTSSLVTGR